MRSVTEEVFAGIEGSTCQVASIAGWSCWLSADTVDGQRQLGRAFQNYLNVDTNELSSCIELRIANADRPRLRIISKGQPCHFPPPDGGSEWKGFVQTAHPYTTAYRYEPLGEAPLFEVRDAEVIVLRPQFWQVVARTMFAWLFIRERPVVNLHAAVSAIGDHSLVLIGSSGAGKSTLSWALHQQGGMFTATNGHFSHCQSIINIHGCAISACGQAAWTFWKTSLSMPLGMKRSQTTRNARSDCLHRVDFARATTLR